MKPKEGCGQDRAYDQVPQRYAQVSVRHADQYVIKLNLCKNAEHTSRKDPQGRTNLAAVAECYHLALPTYERFCCAASNSSTASLPVIPIFTPSSLACGVASTILASNKSSGSTSGLAGVPRAIAIACPNSPAVLMS